ncbi:MBOAT family protein [Alcaligenaceae bacterium LF4-65]|uniref:Probable alginate O-acetylase AlgI n=1 Tax=Zwartia hollandica TaxID=324606 RepID=A0A953N8N9_9BURK|nr:MBOAT family O-acyltransferase [Zwartia hollandica]MBZ1349199.1 MBOAT family protein [Zwartia hollandica]
MVFSSLVFLYLFLPCSLILYYFFGSKFRHGVGADGTTDTGAPTEAQNYILIAVSLFFYAWGEPIWVSLLVLTAAIDWLAALWMERTRGTNGPKLALALSLVSNLSLLGVFKYSDFVVENVNTSFGASFNLPGYALPIGISFYVFQTLSYSIDVYRGDVRAQRRFTDFLLFVSLFPQLVAGPIVRYVHIAAEIRGRRHSWDLFSRGLHRLCVGLFKKVFIANVAGEWAERTMGGDLSTLSTGDAWLGLAMFALQIYFDFSAYSDMAIGLGMMFGFHFHENFNYPYISKSVTEFWRRWHISLSTFFRDYVYIPLGGRARWPYRNLFIVWALTGFWHGPSWNFMLWGLYFGVWIAIERLFLGNLLARLPGLFGHLYLLLIVTLGWALFYFTDLQQLKLFSMILFGFTEAPLFGEQTFTDIQAHALWLPLALVACTPVAPWSSSILVRLDIVRSLVSWRPIAILAVDLVMLLSCTALLVGQSYNPFLYFRF